MNCGYGQVDYTDIRNMSKQKKYIRIKLVIINHNILHAFFLIDTKWFIRYY